MTNLLKYKGGRERSDFLGARDLCNVSDERERERIFLE